jgi:hypothetical protein
MKMPEIHKWFSLLLFISIVATSCSLLTENTTTPTLETPTLVIGSVSPSKAVIGNSTPISTPIDEVTSTPLSTMTVVPTLSVEDARKRFLDLLSTNGSCRLPCLWGIAPGTSNYLEARNILIPLSSIAETAYFDTPYPEDDISPLYVEDDLRLNARVLYLYGSDGVISLITFRVLEEQVTTDSNGNWISRQPIFGLPSFMERTEHYSLSHLLSEQGVPASVMIASSGLSINRDRSIRTRLAIFYPDQGIWAQYTTLVNEKEVRSSIISCPINAHIEMVLSPPGNPDSFFSLLDKTDWGITKNSYKPLEEATSMSVEEFYETFRNPTDRCIETPVNIWPTPER